LLGLCSTFVLARILVPEDFGLVAVATGVVGLLEAFSELSFNQALVRFRDTDDTDYSTVWTLSICRGLLLACIVLILAYPLSTFLNDERLFYVFLAISILPLFRGIENPRLIIYEKNIRFDVFFRLAVITKLAGVLTTIGLVFIWRSYWVLVAGMFVTSGVRAILTYVYARGRLTLTIKSWRKLLRFSGWLSGAEMLGALANRLDPVILMAYATPQAVGVLHIAREVSYMVFNEVAAPLRRVLFPALSKLTPGSDEFIDTYKDNLSGLFFVLAPVSLGFALTAPLFVPLVLGDKWDQAIIPIQLFSLVMAISIVGRLAQSVVMSVGQTRLLFVRNLIFTPIKLFLIFGGAAFYGLQGAVWAFAIQIILMMIINLSMVKKIISLGYFSHIYSVRQSLIPLAGMCILVSYLDLTIKVGSSSSFLLSKLMILIVSGALIYSGLHYFLWRITGSPDGIVKKSLELLSLSLGKFRSR
jgi:PST family polysaccharide transporter